MMWMRTCAFFGIIVRGRLAAALIGLALILAGCGGGGGVSLTGNGAVSVTATGPTGGSTPTPTPIPPAIGNTFNNSSTASVPLVDLTALANEQRAKFALAADDPAPTASQFNLAAASDAVETTHVAFTDTRNKAVTGRDIFTQSLKKNGARARGATGTAVLTAPGDQDLASVAETSEGTLFSATDQQYETRQHVSVSLVKANNALAWGNTGRLVSIRTDQIGSGNIRDETNSQCVTRSDARAWIDWVVKGSAPGLELALVDLTTGTVDFQRTTATNANNAAFFGEPVRLVDGANGLIKVWVMSTNSSNEFDGFAQRYDNTGTPLWGGGQPLRIFSGPLDDFELAACSDSQGGAYVAARSNRNPTALDPSGRKSSAVAVQHVSPTGVTASLEGVVTVDLPGIDQLPSIAFDGSTLGLVWDNQTDPDNINAHTLQFVRIDPTSLTAIGAPTTVASATDLTRPVLTADPDASGGFHLTFSDFDRVSREGKVEYNWLSRAGELVHQGNLNFALGKKNRTSPRGGVMTGNFFGTVWEQFEDEAGPHEALGRPLSKQ